MFLFCVIVYVLLCFFFVFFFNDTATTEIYTLSLHDALPICSLWLTWCATYDDNNIILDRSEEHTSELQSRVDLVCRLLLEKKKKKILQTQAQKKTQIHGSDTKQIYI